LRESERLVRAFFEAVSAGDLPDDLLTPDMTGWLTTAGTMEREAYRGAVRMLARMCREPIRFTIDSIIADGNRAAAEVRSTATLVNGEGYAMTYVYVFTFEGGQIASVAEHYNALVAQEKLVPLMKELQAP